FWRDRLEMRGLAGKRAKAGGDEQKPGKKLVPVGRIAEKPASLLGEVEQDRRRIEDPSRLSAGAFRVHDRRNLAIGVDRAKVGGVLLPLSSIDRDDLVGEARFFEEEGDLGRVWRRVIVEADHSGFL